MKFSTAVRCLSLVVVKGFTTTTTTTTTHARAKLFTPATFGLARTAAAPSSSIARFASGGGTDDYDEWYADFDPAQFDEVEKPARSYGSGGGGSHDYERDSDADTSNVDLNAVNSLISDRLQARKTGRFEEADAIRDQLMDEHGVSIWDKDKKWRSGCSRSGSGSQFGRGGGRGGRNNDRGGGGGRRQRDFGPNGHDYELSPDAGPNVSELSDPQIHALIAERLQCKMSRNFQQADAIQQDFEGMGIYVNDGRKEWRADGARFGDSFGSNQRGGNPGRTAGSRQDRFRPYEESEHSQPSDQVDAIKDLIEERVEAKKARDFDVADDIQRELRDQFNVEVNDKTREWSVGGDFGMGVRKDLAPYSMSSLSVDAEDNVAVIQSLVEDREKARKKRNYQTADDIRDELRDTYDVEINDKIRQWSIGGHFEMQAPGARNDREPADFVRRGGGSLTDDQIKDIAAMIEDRNDAKRDKHFGKADRIRDELRDDFNVRIDDRSREWMVVTDEYAQSPVTPLDEATKAIIEARVAERAVAKLNKEYDTADAIRDELYDEYQVFLDDRVREWRIEGGVVAEVEAPAAPVAAEVEEDDEAKDEMFADLDSALDDVFNDDEDEEVEEEEATTASADTEEATSDESEELQSLKVDELKEKLREAGLPVSGKKAELIERLMEAA